MYLFATKQNVLFIYIYL